ncbi:M90 family metallopeptidase [Flavilitoribacter nigricans]|uniref:Peptidase n=1 Tax=Flavilitoribacter nigricans (strain ATCC 23147 / DSM 23189 / NBRC 102662 / NCIMB 1420 / SS-2) TaxID=1122177 RepID=A0A2D0MXT7_FLAN2|nr:M90 family metallopeptidase [Flavilitoribacter nigricans]PHN01027.1 peptidase [Flavilitoribacter nigricans DSM 23189 = NBRC 102662]
MRPDLLIIVLVLFLILLTWWMFFRKPKTDLGQFPPAWRDILRKKVAFYRDLTEAEQQRFERAIQQFFKDVDITGVEITLDDTDRLLVAASAVIPLFGFPGWRYHNLNEVLLYEGTFNHDYQTEGKERDILGMVGTGAMQRMMILSRKALHAGFEQENSKKNVGIHEFVHLLDKADGATDGIPEVLIERPFAIPWLKEIHEEIREIKNNDSDINPYGATNEAEFFSVASEYFFKQPELFHKNHPELFAMMEKIFRQDLLD